MNEGLIAEWEAQEAVILAFADENSDWAYCLEDVRKCLFEIIKVLVNYTPVYLLCKDENQAKLYMKGLSNITYIQCDFNDTWMRDCSVLSVSTSKGPLFKGFVFNAWGGKFECTLDNKLNEVLLQKGLYPKYDAVDYILEGGALESDGCGTILTTSSCVLNSNRNSNTTKENVSEMLKKELLAKQVLFLDYGYLEGDDTDAHIDTLARFCNEKTIAYVGVPAVDDPHFKAMTQMKKQLESFKNIDNNPYTLVELPFVPAMYDDEQRLPCTYANFLISNGVVLVPTYGFSTDEKALAILKSVFTSYDVVGIDCAVLVREHGSLHCMTMNLAKS